MNDQRIPRPGLLRRRWAAALTDQRGDVPGWVMVTVIKVT